MNIVLNSYRFMVVIRCESEVGDNVCTYNLKKSNMKKLFWTNKSEQQ